MGPPLATWVQRGPAPPVGLPPLRAAPASARTACLLGLPGAPGRGRRAPQAAPRRLLPLSAWGQPPPPPLPGTLGPGKAQLAETERKLRYPTQIIAGRLLFDAASKDKRWSRHLSVLLLRIDRPIDKEPLEGWSIEQYKAEGGKSTIARPPLLSWVTTRQQTNQPGRLRLRIMRPAEHAGCARLRLLPSTT